MTIYDSVQSHRTKDNTISITQIIKPFFTIMSWLKRKQLLTPLGHKAKIDINFKLTSNMLNPLGNMILGRAYSEWRSQIDYKTIPNTLVLDNAFNELKNTQFEANKKVEKKDATVKEMYTMLESLSKEISRIK